MIRYDLSRTFQSNLFSLTQALNLTYLNTQSLTLLAAFSVDEVPRSRDLSLNLSETGHLTLTQTEIDSCYGMLLVSRCMKVEVVDIDTDTETEEERKADKTTLKKAIDEQVKVM